MDRDRLRGVLRANTGAGLITVGSLLLALPVHLDRGDAGVPAQTILAAVGCTGVIPPTGAPAAGHVGGRWAVERPHRWLIAFGRLRRCTERCAAVVAVSLFLAASIIVVQQLLRAAVHTFRWPTRSTTRRLR